MRFRTAVEMRSEKGPVREKNEDCVGALDALETRPGIDALYVVADGLGGHEHGEVASAMAVDLLLDAYRAKEPADPPLLPSSIEDSLAQTLHYANHAIYDAGKARQTLLMGLGRAGMATTATAALLAGDSIYLGHVGDSRAYLLRGGQLTQLTEDHSLVADQVRQGLLRPEEAERHPMRNILTQTVGMGETIVPFTRTLAVEEGDHLLLCSDGLHGFLNDQAIAAIMLREQDNGSVADAFIEEAIAVGGTDNITVLLVSFAGLVEPSQG